MLAVCPSSIYKVVTRLGTIGEAIVATPIWAVPFARANRHGLLPLQAIKISLNKEFH